MSSEVWCWHCLFSGVCSRLRQTFPVQSMWLGPITVVSLLQNNDPVMTNSNSSNSAWSKNDNSFWWLTSMVMLQRFWVLHSRAVLKNSLQLDRSRFFFLEKRYFIQCRKRKHSNHYLVAPCCKAFTEHILI